MYLFKMNTSHYYYAADQLLCKDILEKTSAFYQQYFFSIDAVFGEPIKSLKAKKPTTSTQNCCKYAFEIQSDMAFGTYMMPKRAITRPNIQMPIILGPI